MFRLLRTFVISPKRPSLKISKFAKFELLWKWQNSTFHTDTLFIWTSSFGLMTLSQEKLLMCTLFPLNGTISDDVLVSFHSIKQLESNLCFFFASGHFPILVDWQLYPVPLESSLQWIISLSFCSFSYNGVCFDGLKLSVDDIYGTIHSKSRLWLA